VAAPLSQEVVIGTQPLPIPLVLPLGSRCPFLAIKPFVCLGAFAVLPRLGFARHHVVKHRNGIGETGIFGDEQAPQSVVSALGERVIGQIYPRASSSSGASAVKMGSRSDDGSAFTTR
jgi:hypothetical protein